MRIYVEDTLFCLVDVQDKLYPHVTNKDEIEKVVVENSWYKMGMNRRMNDREFLFRKGKTIGVRIN